MTSVNHSSNVFVGNTLLMSENEKDKKPDDNNVAESGCIATDCRAERQQAALVDMITDEQGDMHIEDKVNPDNKQSLCNGKGSLPIDDSRLQSAFQHYRHRQKSCFDAEECDCEGCGLRTFCCKTDEQVAHVILSRWKEFLIFFREVYINPPLIPPNHETLIRKVCDSIEATVEVFRLCDPLVLLGKLEYEIFQVMLSVRRGLLEIFKKPNNEEDVGFFLKAMLEEYVKLLTSSSWMSPIAEMILGAQLKKLDLTWNVVNKYAYLSLIYMHPEIQVVMACQLKKILSVDGTVYNDLFHQYMLLEQEMNTLDTKLKKMGPEKLRKIETEERDLMSIFSSLKWGFYETATSTTKSNEPPPKCNGIATDVETNDKNHLCRVCKTRRECSCTYCISAHNAFCKARSCYPKCSIWVPNESNSSIDLKIWKDAGAESEESCECSACTMPADSQNLELNLSDIKNEGLVGEGFNLYPHIHGVSSVDSNNRTNPPINNKRVPFPPTNYSHLYSVRSKLPVDFETLPLKQLNGTLSSRAMKALRSHRMELRCSLAPKEYSAINTPKNKLENNGEVTSNNGNDISRDKADNATTIDEETASLIASIESIKTEQIFPPAAAAASHVKKEESGNKQSGCAKSGVCGKCIKHNKPNSKTAERHLVTITRLGLRKSSFNNKCSESKHKHPAKSPPLPGDRGGDGVEDPEADESYSLEDDCSDTCSNSTETIHSNTKDAKHCDCCYCEVFGHSVPSVPPMSRNYAEMRDRLRMRLNLKKKSIKTQNSAPPPVDTNKMPSPAPTSELAEPSQADEKASWLPNELDSVIEYIEGRMKKECIDEKKIAKRARQKQKKLEEKEEKERQEREAARLKAEALKLAKKLKKKQKKLQKKTQPDSEPMSTTPIDQIDNDRFNISGLKRLVEQCPSGSEPKMVTIKRVMEPFSQPTVTITLKGSTPEQDKILYMLKNGAEKMEESRNDSKSKKQKKGQTDEVTKFSEIPSVSQMPLLNPNLTKKQRQKLKKALEKEQEQKQQEQLVTISNKSKQQNVKKLSNNQPEKSKPEKQSPKARSVLKQSDGVTTIEIYSMGENKQKPAVDVGAESKVAVTSQTVKDRAPVEHLSNSDKCEVTVTRSSVNGVPTSYKLSEVIGSIAPAQPPSASALAKSRSKEITLENLRLPPGITITKIEGPVKKTIQARDTPGCVTKPDAYPTMTPIHASLKPVQTSSAATATVAPTSFNSMRMRQTVKDSSYPTAPAVATNFTSMGAMDKKKKKKKKPGQQQDTEEIIVATRPAPVNPVPTALNQQQQATIIKTGDNMVTIRSPAVQALHQDLQQLRLHNHQTQDTAIINQMSRLSINQQQPQHQLKNNQKGKFTDVVGGPAILDDSSKKGKKKRKNKNTTKVGKDIELIENVFQPKDIDLDNGDIDDDERELEAFKRFCLQSVPPERKDKVKVNLNLKDIVLKRKSSAIGCT